MWQYFCNIKNISLGPTMSMKINSQKKSIFPMKNFLDNSFSYCRVCQTSGKFMIGSTRYYSNQCTSYKIDSVTPKILLKTQCKKKGYISSEKKNFGQFSLVLSSMKNFYGTFYRGPQGIGSPIEQVIRSFL